MSGHVTQISILNLKHVPGYVNRDMCRATNFISFQINMYIPTATHKTPFIGPSYDQCDARYIMYAFEEDACSRVSIKNLYL